MGHDQSQTLLELGEIRERERIIALLDDPFWHNIRFPDIHDDCVMCAAIALIKGDNK